MTGSAFRGALLRDLTKETAASKQVSTGPAELMRNMVNESALFLNLAACLRHGSLSASILVCMSMCASSELRMMLAKALNIDVGGCLRSWPLQYFLLGHLSLQELFVLRSSIARTKGEKCPSENPNGLSGRDAD